MRVVHILSGGGTGGIETLCKDYAKYSKLDNIFIFVWRGGPNADEIKEHGGRVIEIDASKKEWMSALKRIYKLCREERADAILVHHDDPLIYACAMFIKKQFSNVKLIAYAHENAADMCRVNKRGRGALKKSIVRGFFKLADRVVAISESVKDSLTDVFDVTEDKISIVYNGVDLNRFMPVLRPIKAPVSIIYVGRLVREKGVQVILRGLSLLPKELDYGFSIVGDGPYRTALEEMTAELGLSGKVRFLGERRDVPQLLSGADVFVHMPVWEEGFGITIVEAMAAGLICVCARSGAISEIITDGEDGFLVEKEDSNALAEILGYIISGEIKELMNIRENAAESSKRFSIEKFAGELDMVIAMN